MVLPQHTRFDTISLAQEIMINTFFKSIRENCESHNLTNDQEILLVLDCMKCMMKGTEDEHADTLSNYLGVRV